MEKLLRHNGYLIYFLLPKIKKLFYKRFNSKTQLTFSNINRANFIQGLILIFFLFLSMIAFTRLSDGYQSLLNLTNDDSEKALDLKQRHKEVHAWFEGKIVYKSFKNTVYPPASMVLLYPINGWLSLEATRFFWAFLMSVALGWLVHFFIKESNTPNPIEKFGLAIILLGTPSTYLTLFQGQLILFVLPMILFSLHLVFRIQSSWKRDILITIFFTTSLVKPTISAPFFLLILFADKGIRPAILIICWYILLTIFALYFQIDDSFELLVRWFKKASHTYNDGEGNLQEITRKKGNFKNFNLFFSLLFLAVFSIWLFFNRQKNYWLLIGTTALFARLWIYHRIYDNLLILLGMFSLYLIWKSKHLGKYWKHISLGLIIANLSLMFLPGQIRDYFKWSVVEIANLKFIIWIGMFLFLGLCTQISHKLIDIKKIGANF